LINNKKAVHLFVLLLATSIIFTSQLSQSTATSIFSDGFESAGFSAWTSTVGSPTIQTTITHHGSYAMQTDTTNNEWVRKDALTNFKNVRLYIYFASLPTTGNKLNFLDTWGSPSEIVVGVKNDGGTLKWGITYPTEQYAALPSPKTGVWYCVELAVSVGSNVKVYVDGVEVISRNGAYSAFNNLFVGAFSKAEALTNYADCIVVADSYIGPETNSTPTPTPTPTPTNPLTPILFSIQVYGGYGSLNPSLIQQISKFDLVNTDFEVTNIAAIKQANPNIIAIGYKDMLTTRTSAPDWLTVNAHEDWFYHDINGNRIAEKNYGGYLMDPANVGWRTYFASLTKQKITTGGFDGVFIDDVWTSLWKDEFAIPATMIPDYPNWQQAIAGFLNYVKTQLPDKLVIANSPDNDLYYTVCNGKMAESFLDIWPGTINTINAEKTITGNSKYYLTLSYGTADTLSNMMYYYSGYLLGLNGPHAYFAWYNVYSSSQGYYPVMTQSKVIGSPTAPYYAYQSIYARDFTNGIVLFNPGTSSYVINLSTTYKTLDGTAVNSVTISGHSGIILKKT
jgi:hypothetical protein